MKLEKRVVLLEGKNGSGKTTLLKCLSGLVCTDHGFLRHQMEYVAGGEALPENMTARRYLEAVLRMSGDEYVKRLERLTAQFELAPFLDVSIRACSDGMRQRLALAGGLLQRGRPLLLDEPMRTLDARYRRRLVEWIGQSADAFLIATHAPEAYGALDAERLRL